jgi:hypothetical protein
MVTNSKKCRNCESARVVTSKSGFLAHFFLKRVFGLEVLSLHEQLKERLRGGVLRNA